MINKNPILQKIKELVFNNKYLLNSNKTSNLYSYSPVIESFKKGRKILIKKKNRGSFTRYCGGNVTEECIRKAKNSSDPKIRKKAIFAQNARSWNHS